MSRSTSILLLGGTRPEADRLRRTLTRHFLLVERARDHGFHTVIARIGHESEGSIAVHARVGFTEIGREREVGRKFGRWLDVAIMQLLLTGPTGADRSPR